VTSLVFRHAVDDPERIALVFPRRRGWGVLDYRGLAARVAAVAEGLRRRGVGRGERVVLLVPMSAELYVSLLAVVSLGAVAVFVEPGAGIDGVAHAVRTTRPVALIGVARAHALRALRADVARVPLAVLVGPRAAARAVGAVALSELEADGAGASLPEQRAAGDEPVLLTFSSGSTGLAKGATRSHGFLAAQHQAIERLVARPDGAADVHMSAFAIVVLSVLAAGQTAVIPPLGRGGVADVEGAALVDLIAERGVTVVSGSPAFLAPLVAAARQRGALAGVRRVISGGAPVPLDLVDALDHRLLPDGSFLVVYGSTEAEPIATIEAGELRGALADRVRAGEGLCVGRADADVEVRLLRPADGPLAIGPGGIAGLEVAAGEVGEVAVAGPHVNRGYYRNHAAVRLHKVRDQDGRVWHRTGDAGRFDGDGRLWIVGRIGDVVRRGAAVYHPAAVEAAAQGLAFVARAALIESSAGETVLVVEPRLPRSLGGLRAAARAGAVRPVEALRSHLGAAGITIDRVVMARRLPVDTRHRAKIDYPEVRRRYA